LLHGQKTEGADNAAHADDPEDHEQSNGEERKSEPVRHIDAHNCAKCAPERKLRALPFLKHVNGGKSAIQREKQEKQGWTHKRDAFAIGPDLVDH